MVMKRKAASGIDASAKRRKLETGGKADAGGDGEKRSKADVKAWTDTTKISYKPDGKRPGTASFVRYKKYSKAKSVAEALKLGSSRADLMNDYEKGMIKVLAGQAKALKAEKVAPCAGANNTLQCVKNPAGARKLTDGIRLRNGAVMPVVGYGTYKLKKGQAAAPVLEALKAGYRLIDTAQVYENEGDVGAALRKSGIPRANVFIETKVWRSSHGYERTMKAFNHSLKQLGTDYVDLYVIHWPGAKTGWPLKRGTVCPPNWKPTLRDGGKGGTWRAMEDLYDQGKVRALGVTNYSVRHLKTLLNNCRIKPEINQVEFHPRLVQKDMLDLCKKQGIALQAYASLGSGDAGQAEDFMKFPPVVAAAKAHRKTPAQVLLRWAIDKGCHIVPKSVKATRMKENAGVFGFRLSSKEVAAIDKLHTGTRYAWKGLDPDTVK